VRWVGRTATANMSAQLWGVLRSFRARITSCGTSRLATRRVRSKDDMSRKTTLTLYALPVKSSISVPADTSHAAVLRGAFSNQEVRLQNQYCEQTNRTCDTHTRLRIYFKNLHPQRMQVAAIQRLSQSSSVSHLCRW
jgi:hypothetical protein